MDEAYKLYGQHHAKADQIKLAQRARGLRERAAWTSNEIDVKEWDNHEWSEGEKEGELLSIMHDIAEATRIQTYLDALREGGGHGLWRCIVVNASKPKAAAPIHNRPRMPYMLDLTLGYGRDAGPLPHKPTMKAAIKLSFR